MATNILMPALSPTMTEGTLAKWLKKVGDPAAADEPLVELETDKVTVEVPAPGPGTIAAIAANAGAEPSVVVNKVVENKGNFGYNAATGEYGDMLEMGVLDPAKVTRSALQHAASVAGLMLTTDCMIAELPEDKPAAGGMPDMGGMGGMGGMM